MRKKSPIEVAMPEKRWFSLEEAIAWTGTDENWIRKMVERGEIEPTPTADRLPSATRGPKRERFDRYELDAAMIRGKIKAANKVAEPLKAQKESKPSTGKLTARERLERGMN
jgi:hypothetical protein